MKEKQRITNGKGPTRTPTRLRRFLFARKENMTEDEKLPGGTMEGMNERPPYISEPGKSRAFSGFHGFQKISLSARNRIF